MDRLALLIVAALAGRAGAQPVNTNLVVNGGAETGDTSGWVDGGIEAQPPDQFSAGFGDWVFTGRLGPTTQTLSQDIAIGSLGGAVDAGAIRAVVSLYIQSRRAGGTADVGSATFTFVSASGGTLAELSYTDEADKLPEWGQFGDELVVPPGTRTIRVRLTATRNGGASTDAFFDEISVRLLGCGLADLAAPFGLLDLADIVAFVSAFTAQDAGVDFDGNGLFDLVDITTFAQAFVSGCP